VPASQLSSQLAAQLRQALGRQRLPQHFRGAIACALREYSRIQRDQRAREAASRAIRQLIAAKNGLSPYGLAINGGESDFARTVGAVMPELEKLIAQFPGDPPGHGDPHGPKFHLRTLVLKSLVDLGVPVYGTGKRSRAARVLAAVLVEADRLSGHKVHSPGTTTAHPRFHTKQWREIVELFAEEEDEWFYDPARDAWVFF
jgi:hypothetical protein